MDTSEKGAAAKLSAGVALNDRELSAVLGVAVQTLRNWRQRGQGPRWVRLGKRLVRYPASGVRAFIEGREPAPAAELQS